MIRNEHRTLDEISLLKGFFLLLGCGLSYALTVVFAGWFLFIFGPIGLLLLLAGSIITMLTRQEGTKVAGLWLATVGGAIAAGPAFYLLFWATGR